MKKISKMIRQMDLNTKRKNLFLIHPSIIFVKINCNYIFLTHTLIARVIASGLCCELLPMIKGIRVGRFFVLKTIRLKFLLVDRSFLKKVHC